MAERAVVRKIYCEAQQEEQGQRGVAKEEREMKEPCPQCGAQLSFDMVDTYGFDVHQSMPRCENCHWKPGAVRVPCECGCGRTSFDPSAEFNHAEKVK